VSLTFYSPFLCFFLESWLWTSALCSVARDESINTLVAVGVAKEVFRLVNLKRAPGAAGQLGGFKGQMDGPAKSATTFILKDQSFTAFPQSMEVVYTGKA